MEIKKKKNTWIKVEHDVSLSIAMVIQNKLCI